MFPLRCARCRLVGLAVGPLILELRNIRARDERLSPAPVITTTRTSGSASNASSTFGIASHISLEDRRCAARDCRNHPSDWRVFFSDQLLRFRVHGFHPSNRVLIAKLGNCGVVVAKLVKNFIGMLPASGVAVLSALSVRESVNGCPTSFMLPSFGCSTLCAIPRCRTWGSANTWSIC